MAKGHFAYYLLRSIPGVGRILTLLLLYEIEDTRQAVGELTTDTIVVVELVKLENEIRALD